MVKTLKQFITDYMTEEGWAITKEDLFETLEECFDTVWESAGDRHRWYTLHDVVYKVVIDNQERYFKYYTIDAHGDGGREDCGFKVPDLDDLVEVYPHEVKTIIYKKEKQQ